MSYKRWKVNNVWCNENQSKHSTVSLLCLPWFSLHQTLQYLLKIHKCAPVSNIYFFFFTAIIWRKKVLSVWIQWKVCLAQQVATPVRIQILILWGSNQTWKKRCTPIPRPQCQLRSPSGLESIRTITSINNISLITGIINT